MPDIFKSKRVLGAIVALLFDILIQYVPELEPLRGETLLVMNAFVVALIAATSYRPTTK